MMDSAQRAAIGYIGADSIDQIDDTAPRLVTVELGGMAVDGLDGQQYSGELVLSKKSAGYAIWAIAKSIGLDEEAEAMLKDAGIEGFA